MCCVLSLFQLRESEIPEDAFTTEKIEEAAMVMGPQSSISTAWRTQEHLQELAYTQLWCVHGGPYTVNPNGQACAVSH